MFEERYRQSLSEPDRKLLSETERMMRTVRSPKKHVMHRGVAACLGLLLAVPLFLLGVLQDIEPVREPAFWADAQSSPQPAAQADEIYINDLTGQAEADRAMKLQIPQDAYEQSLTVEQVFSYLGRDIRPLSLPQGLKEYSGEMGQRDDRIIYNKDGTVAYDTFYFQYSEDFTSGSLLVRNLAISVSRTGLINDCVYLDQSEMKPSRVSGVAMQIGLRRMSYGPYRNPDGYYDLYLAEFYFEGIHYEVTSNNLTQEEFIGAVSSMLT